MTTFEQGRYLEYPDTWSKDSIAAWEHLARMGKVAQADVWKAESHLQWVREWRDYFATTGGKDETLQQGYKRASGE